AVAGWDVGGGAMIDADYYSGDYNDRFGEGRLESFAFASHSLGPGTATATFITHGVYTNDFSDRFFQLWISSLGYSVTRGAFTFRGTAEYEDADVPEERRTRLATTVGYAFPRPTWGYDVSLEGSLAFSDFNGGANANRNDVVAGLALTADRKFGRGWALEWEAALINRFSNRDRSRFTAVDVGVELAKRF
ncbi:MAG TPA: hypothetical protein VFW13_15360, partial [Phenylobacterium sp.]|nr:hypothetical protein [Phenylobacterium sp.]